MALYLQTLEVVEQSGVGFLCNSRCSYFAEGFAVIACRAMDWHFGTFALLSAQCSQSDTLESRNWHDAGESATRQVSSAYCRMFTW